MSETENVIVATRESIKANPPVQSNEKFLKSACIAVMEASHVANRQLSYFCNPYHSLLCAVILNLRW